MKLKIILAGAIFCAMVAAPAHAVTKCVALSGSGTTCTSDFRSYYNKTDWAATCTTNGVSTPISGIARCSSTDGGSEGATATELDVSYTAGENMNCWCKMISPAVSRWVFFFSSGPGEDASCNANCAASCANRVKNSATFRRALFGSLSD